MKFFRSFWKAFSWTLLIMVLSIISGDNMNEIGFFQVYQIDKVAHAFMYFVQTFLLISAFQKYYPGKNQISTLFWPFFIAFVTGGMLEFIQSFFLPNRSGDILDFLANISGSLFAILLYSRIKKMIEYIPFNKKMEK